MQILVDRCQNLDCGKQLTWRRANGVCYCGYCGADIRDFISEYVSVKYQSACRFAAGLVNPDPTERRLSYTQLPKLLAGYDSGFLLDLAVRLAFIHELKTVGVGTERSHVAVTSGHFTEVDLARGARMVLGWPNSLYHLIDRLRGESHTRYGSYGVTKEIGPVATFMANPNIPDVMRSLVKSEVDRYYAGRDDVVLRASDHRANGRAVGYYTMQQTAEKCGIQPKMIRRLLEHPDTLIIRAEDAQRSPFMFNLDQVSAWNERRLQLIECRDVQKMLGIPQYAVHHLVERKIINIETGPPVLMMGALDRTTWFHCGEISRFIAQMLGDHPTCKHVQKGCISASDLLNDACGLAPWSTVLDALLDGRIKVHQVLEGSSNLMARLLIPPIPFKVLVDSFSLHREIVDHDPTGLMSTKAASELIGCSEVAITWLVSAGLIKAKRVGSNRRRPIQKSVYDFNKSFMLGGEVCHATGLHKRVLSLRLKAKGIFPAAVLQDSGRTVWSRDTIQKLLEEQQSLGP